MSSIEQLLEEKVAVLQRRFDRFQEKLTPGLNESEAELEDAEIALIDAKIALETHRREGRGNKYT